MLFLDLLKYVRPIEEIDIHLEAHREWLERAIEEGAVLMAGRRDPRIGGVIIVKAATIDEARWLVEADPFIVARVAEYELIAWEPTMRSADAPAHWAPAARVIGGNLAEDRS